MNAGQLHDLPGRELKPGRAPDGRCRLAGRLLGDKAVQLSEVTYRCHRRQWWTPDLPAGTAVPAEMPVAVLVSGCKPVRRRAHGSGGRCK